MKTFLAQLRGACCATLALAVVCCGAYPLFVCGVAQAVFPEKADGSLIAGQDGVVRGSRLIGQNFTGLRYFHPRPSAAGSGYDAASSGGSNLGPTSRKLHDAIKERIAAYRSINGLDEAAAIPADAVTASASGLDPHISLSNAQLQSARVAKARNLSPEKVNKLVQQHLQPPDFGILGEAAVNVLLLNMALDSNR